mgnify:CR=1 FL=1
MNLRRTFSSILAAISLVSCGDSGIASETIKHEVEGEVLELKECQAPLTMEKYNAIQAVSDWSERNNNTLLREANEILGCRLQFAQATESQHANYYMAIQRDRLGNKRAIIVVGFTQSNGDIVLMRKAQFGLDEDRR